MTRKFQDSITRQRQFVLASFATFVVHERVKFPPSSFYRMVASLMRPAKIDIRTYYWGAHVIYMSDFAYTNTYFDIRTSDFLAVQSTHGQHSMISILKMHKCIVLDFLYTFHFAILFERFFQLFLADLLCQVAHIQHLDFTHSWFVWLFLWIRPVDNNITTPNLIKRKQLWSYLEGAFARMNVYLNSASSKSSFCQWSCFVWFIFQEAETTVFLLIVRWTINYNFNESSCGKAYDDF